MLFTLGLIFLLTPFPSIQTTTSEKRDAPVSNVTKHNAVFTVSKPKTTSVPAKQSLNSNLNPKTVTVTILPTAATNQKSTTTHTATTNRSKLGVAVVQTTPPPAAKASKATGINRDKHKINRTVSAKLLFLSEEKDRKNRHGPTGAPKDQSTVTKVSSGSTLTTTKNKPQHSDNQTISAKSPSTSDEKNAKGKSNHNVYSNGSKTTKDKATVSSNLIIRDIPLNEKLKDKSTTNVPSLPASGSKSTQEKAKASGNQTITHTHLLKSDEKSKGKSIPSVLSLLTSSAKTTKDTHKPSGNQTAVDAHHHSNDQKTKDKPGERVGGFIKDKEMDTTAIAHTPSTKATCKGNIAPSQPIKVVISNEGDSSHTKEEELTLKPGAPLVMTHRINLLPGGCTGGCEAEMAALKERLTRLEREMSFLKEKCSYVLHYI